jgi:hypothetical protein
MTWIDAEPTSVGGCEPEMRCPLETYPFWQPGVVPGAFADWQLSDAITPSSGRRSYGAWSHDSSCARFGRKAASYFFVLGAAPL